MRTRFALAALIAAGAVAIGAVAVASTSDPVARAGPGSHPVQYSVKVVCGFYPPGQDTETVKPGNYATSINIHNYTDARLFGRWRTDLYYSLGTPAPPRLGSTFVAVASRRTGTIDCGSIWANAGLPPGTFLEGSIYMGFDLALPVRAVYTAQTDIDPSFPGPDSGAGISIDVEVYEPITGVVAYDG